MTSSTARKDCPDNGVTARALEGVRWRRVTHGRYVPVGAPAELIDEVDAVAPVLPPGGAFSHFTAARLYGLWLSRLPDWMPITASLPPEAQRPERAGLYVARSRAALPAPWDLAGVPVLAPEYVVAQLAEDLQLIDLVAAIDSAFQLRLCSMDSVLAGLRSRQRGLPMLRQTLARCDGRSESAWETYLRLLHELSGISVEPQYKVLSTAGSIIARADLRITGTRRLPEYDGANHREKERHEQDLEREKLLSRHGYARFGYIARELIGSPQRIIADAEDALGLRRDPRRIADWLDQVSRSSLSLEGRRRLDIRLRRFVKPLRGRGKRRDPTRNCGKLRDSEA